MLWVLELVGVINHPASLKVKDKLITFWPLLDKSWASEIKEMNLTQPLIWETVTQNLSGHRELFLVSVMHQHLVYRSIVATIPVISIPVICMQHFMVCLVFICLCNRFSKYNHNNISILYALLECDLDILPSLKAPGLATTKRMRWKRGCVISEARP